jgi:hypothetical protein
MGDQAAVAVLGQAAQTGVLLYLQHKALPEVLHNRTPVFEIMQVAAVALARWVIVSVTTGI